MSAGPLGAPSFSSDSSNRRRCDGADARSRHAHPRDLIASPGVLEELETRHEVSADINMTPMIDVLLCLLIIFLVAAPPPPSEQQPVAIPDDPVTEQPDDPNATLLITVAEDGSATLGESPLPNDYPGIVEAIRSSEKAQADGRLAIQAAAKVPYGRVISLMSAAREAGVSSVGLASERL